MDPDKLGFGVKGRIEGSALYCSLGLASVPRNVCQVPGRDVLSVIKARLDENCTAGGV